MRFSEMVLRSLAARIESMMVTNDVSTSGGTMELDMCQQLRSTISAEYSSKGYSHDMMYWSSNRVP